MINNNKKIHYELNAYVKDKLISRIIQMINENKKIMRHTSEISIKIHYLVQILSKNVWEKFHSKEKKSITNFKKWKIQIKNPRRIWKVFLLIFK